MSACGGWPSSAQWIILGGFKPLRQGYTMAIPRQPIGTAVLWKRLKRVNNLVSFMVNI